MKTWLRQFGWMVWISGCVSSGGPGSDTSTDWLETCETQSECSSDRLCGCGLCTRECERDSDCADLSPSAVCERSQTACGSAQSFCVPDRDFSWLEHDASDASTDNQGTLADDPATTALDHTTSDSSADAAAPAVTAEPIVNSDITSEPSDAASPRETGAELERTDASVGELDAASPCKDSDSCSAEQACALGQCDNCESLAYVERSAYTSTFEAADEGCTAKTDCVYFKRDAACEDLACEWQASTPLALPHADAVMERVRADSTEICAASSMLGKCERQGDCLGDLGGLQELACVDQRCVVPLRPNPCTLDAYAPRAQLEVLDCGYIESIGAEEEVRDAAFDCILTAFDDCTPAILTTVDIDQEGQRYVTQLLIEPGDDTCGIAKFTDSRDDRFTSTSSLERSTCTGLGAGSGGSPPHAQDCTLAARCPFLTSWL